jgi:hypothetical protein
MSLIEGLELLKLLRDILPPGHWLIIVVVLLMVVRFSIRVEITNSRK